MVPMWGVCCNVLSIAFELKMSASFVSVIFTPLLFVPFFRCYSCCVFSVLLNTRAEMQRYVAERFVQLLTQKGQ